MLLIIDKDTKNVVMNFGTNSACPDGNFLSLQELPIEQEYIKIHDNSDIAQKIKSSYEYNLVLGDNNNVIDVNVIKTKEQYQNEQANILIEEPIDVEKVAMAESIIDLEARLSALENK